jgi:hypothetical protein
MIRLFTLALLGCTLFLLQCSTDQSESLLSDNGGISGSITRFARLNGFMYVLDQNKIKTFSLAQPDQPILVHELTADYGLETITIYDGTIYVGSTTSLYILNLDVPAEPRILSQTNRASFGFDEGCDPVVVRGNYAYSTVKIVERVCGTPMTFSVLLIYDVSNKAQPSLVYEYEMVEPNGLGIKDDYLIVCEAGSDVLAIFDISQPNLAVLTTFSVPITNPIDLIVDGQKMIVATKTDLQIFDVSDMTRIKKIGQIDR